MSSTENKKFTFDHHLVFCDNRTQFPLRQVLLEPSFHSSKRVARDFIFIIFRVPEWTRETLVHRFITTHIQPGTVIFSDQFTLYIPLNQLEYIHVSVNHSKNFVDPDSGAHTNTIEGVGALVKKKLKWMCGTLYEYIPSYLDVDKHAGSVSADASVVCWCAGSVLVVCRPTRWPTCWPKRWWDQILNFNLFISQCIKWHPLHSCHDNRFASSSSLFGTGVSTFCLNQTSFTLDELIRRPTATRALLCLLSRTVCLSWFHIDIWDFTAPSVKYG